MPAGGGAVPGAGRARRTRRDPGLPVAAAVDRSKRRAAPAVVAPPPARSSHTAPPATEAAGPADPSFAPPPGTELAKRAQDPRLLGSVAMIAAAIIGVAGLIAIIGAVADTQVPVRSGDVAGATGASSPTTSLASPAPSPRLVAVPTAPTGTGFAVDVAEQAIVTWTDAFGQVRVEVIVAVENRGSVAAMLAAGETDYTIVSPTGQTAASGRFSRAFPPVVQPGQRAYLIDALAATFVDETELAKLEVKVRAVPATTTDVVMLTVDAVRTSTEGGTVAVSGVVKSAAQATAGPVTVVAILRDAAGKILCGLYDVGDAGAVVAGGSTSFSTSYPDAPPLDPAAVDAAEVFAFVDPVQVAEAAR